MSKKDHHFKMHMLHALELNDTRGHAGMPDSSKHAKTRQTDEHLLGKIK